MDTPTPTSPAKGTAPTPAPAAKGGIVGAHPRPTRPRHLAWLSAAVLVAHLGALAWWLAPTRPEASPLTPAGTPTGVATGTAPRLVAALPPVPASMVSAALINSASAIDSVAVDNPPPQTDPARAVATDPAQALVQARGQTDASGQPSDSNTPPAQALKPAKARQAATDETSPRPAPPRQKAASENFKKDSDPTLSNIQQFAIYPGNSTTTHTLPTQPQAVTVPVRLNTGSAGLDMEAQSPNTPDAPLPPRTTLATHTTHAAVDGTADDTMQVAAATVTKGAPGTRSTTPPAAADTVAGPLRVPPSTTLEFQVTARRKGLELPARSTLRWEVDGSTYSASLVIQMPFVRSRSQTSVGSVDPVLGLQPRRFGDKNRTEVATHFDRSRTPAVIRFSANAPSVPLQAQSQDRLSVLFQLAAQVAGAPTQFKEGQRATIHTAGSRDAELWVFRVVGNDHLSLPAGPMDTVHLVREAESAYDNRVDVWLAPSLSYLPVRILWTQSNGDVVEQALSEHTPQSPAHAP